MSDPATGPKPDRRRPFVADVPMLAAIFAVPQSTIFLWARAHGMPKLGRGRYDLAAVLTWYTARARGTPAEQAVTAARRQLLDSQRQHLELEVTQQRAGLLPAAEVSAMIRALLVLLDGHLDRFAQRASRTVAAEREPGKVARVILGEAHQTRRAAAESVLALAGEPDQGAPGQRDPGVPIRLPRRPSPRASG